MKNIDACVFVDTSLQMNSQTKNNAFPLKAERRKLQRRHRQQPLREVSSKGTILHSALE